jgi:hypothetical protein
MVGQESGNNNNNNNNNYNNKQVLIRETGTILK